MTHIYISALHYFPDWQVTVKEKVQMCLQKAAKKKNVWFKVRVTATQHLETIGNWDKTFHLTTP